MCSALKFALSPQDRTGGTPLHMAGMDDEGTKHEALLGQATASSWHTSLPPPLLDTRVRAGTCQHHSPRTTGRPASVHVGDDEKCFHPQLDTQESMWLVLPAQLGDLRSPCFKGGL